MNNSKRFQAVGRLKQGEMNKAEEAYSWVLERRKNAGEVAWYKFEAITLKLADNTRYTVDFFVMLINGELEAHEVKVKAIFQDDAKVKIKVAAAMFPFRFILAFAQTKKDGGGFVLEEV
jgi:hypothetical protein